MTQFELISVEFNRANLSKMPDHKQGACGKLITLTDHHCIHTMEQEAGSSPRPNSYILLTSSAVAYRPYPYQTLTLVPTLTRVPRRLNRYTNRSVSDTATNQTLSTAEKAHSFSSKLRFGHKLHHLFCWTFCFILSPLLYSFNPIETSSLRNMSYQILICLENSIREFSSP